MKHYIDYTEQELDELYAKLSEVAQDFVYSDIIKDEVANVGKETGLHIDKWEALDTLVLETVLGIVPASMFKSEVQNRLGTTSEITTAIVAHMDAEIFSVIRDESVSEYSDINDSNISPQSAGAIYDNALDSLSDPYRENVGGSHNNAPVITEEKLHLVDELFAAHSPKVKELTPADGSVRVPTEDSKHVPELFEKKISVPASPMPGVITKASLEAAESPEGAFDGAHRVDEILKTLPPLENLTVPNTISKIEPVEKSLVSEASVNEGKVSIHIEKSETPGKVILHMVSNIPPLSHTIKTRPQSEPSALSSLPPTTVHYEVDPYKEVL